MRKRKMNCFHSGRDQPFRGKSSDAVHLLKLRWYKISRLYTIKCIQRVGDSTGESCYPSCGAGSSWWFFLSPISSLCAGFVTTNQLRLPPSSHLFLYFAASLSLFLSLRFHTAFKSKWAVSSLYLKKQLSPSMDVQTSTPLSTLELTQQTTTSCNHKQTSWKYFHN